MAKGKLAPNGLAVATGRLNENQKTFKIENIFEKNEELNYENDY
jgi:hypothetical protein